MPRLSLHASQKTKDTPAGQIPVDWACVRFGEIAEFRNGLNFIRSDNGAKIKIVGVGDFQKHFRIKYDALDTIQLAGEMEKFDLLQNGDLLFVRSNGNKELIGRCLLIDNLNEPVGFSGFTIRARLRDGHTSPIFTGYFFQSGLAKNEISEAGGGTNISNLSQGILAALSIPLPPLPEQQKIAAILGTWDEALEKLNALIAAKDRRKQALTEQLITGTRRLPGFSKPWPQTSFGQFLTESRIPGSDGLTAQKITVKLYGRGVFGKQERMVGSSNTKYFIRRAGQLIYSKLDFLNGAFGIIPPELDGYESTLDLPAFDLKPSADARWILAYLVRPEFYEKQVGAASGGRIARRINPPEFVKLRLKAPDISEQRAIADILDAADAELRLLRQQRAALDHQKRGLMQQLLSGKVRVST